MGDGSRMLEVYLGELGAALGGLPPDARTEILAELRSHVRDSAGSGLAEPAVAAALARLGPAAELAARYEAEGLFARAERSHSPWLLASALARLASESLIGAFALIGLVCGYLLAVSFFLAALSKPFAPSRTGLWLLPGGELSLHLGWVTGAQTGRELLGWWIVPLGLLLGAATCWATPRLARRAIRRSRRPRPGPAR